MAGIGRGIVLLLLAGASLRAQSPRVIIGPMHPPPGALVRVTLDHLPRADDSVTAVAGTMAGEPLHFARAAAGAWHALGGIPVDASDSIVARVVTERASGRVDTIIATMRYPHQVAAQPGGRGRPPRARRLTVDRRFTQRLDSATEARIENEAAEARDVGRHAHQTPPLWTEPFLKPRTTRVTSRFGSGRVFNGRVASSHLGIDYAGKPGEPIRAANRGVVALVAEFFLAGNVVYIDHGGGIVTGYFHMSQPLVAMGDTVARGQEIGLVGATGRVTGPHLHWSARYGAITVDPADLLTLEPGWYGACGRSACPR
jgi:murein DD-endopeptidase MepM/ murein hydrolase activator NlpD